MTLLEQVGLSQLMSENFQLRKRLADADAGDLGRQNGLPADDAAWLFAQLENALATIVVDDDDMIIHWSAATQVLLGWSAQEMLGRPFEAILARENPAPLFPSSGHGSEASLTARWYWRANGTRLKASALTRKLFNADGSPRGLVLVLRRCSDKSQDFRALDNALDHSPSPLVASDLVCIWTWDMQKDRVYVDARSAALFGLDPGLAEKGLGVAEYIERIHPGDRERIAQEIEASVNTGRPFSAEFRTLTPAGEVCHIKARGCCRRDALGRPDQFSGALVDVTTERLWQARQMALLQISDDVLSAGPDFDHAARIAEILGRTLGLCRAGFVQVEPGGTVASVIGQWTDKGVAPLPAMLERRRFGTHLAAALEDGLVAIGDVARHPLTRDALDAWVQIGVMAFAIFPDANQDRQAPTLFLHRSHPHDWKDDEIGFVREALRRSSRFAESQRLHHARLNAETRLRLAQEAANIGTFDYNLLNGEMLWDERCRAAFGIFDDQPVSFEETFVPGLHPEERKAVMAAVAQALAPGSDGAFDMVHRTIGRDDGLVRWLQANGQTVVENDVAVRFVGAVRDITRDREDEERRQFLARELQHRVKNTLAMVNALANQTMRRAPTAQAGLATFTDRLIALSRANDLLIQSSWQDANINDIVDEALRTLQPEDEGRVLWNGPPVLLTAKQSLALGLALHELSTNAVKYGALCNDEGRISVSWTVTGQPDASILRLEWRESDGPRVIVPTAFGFGSRLIEKTLALEFGGKVALSYHETGVVCVVEAPISAQSHAV